MRGRYPGVILIHDIFGVSDHARDVARRFTYAGLLILVPDCFARIDLGTGESLEDIRPRAALLDDRLTVQDLENAALIPALPYGNGKIGAGPARAGSSAARLALAMKLTR